MVSEELGGLPGAGIEGVWVTIHPLDDHAFRLEALPPMISQAQTGPQGEFAVALGRRRALAYVIAVRTEPDSAPLTARPVEDEAVDRAAPIVLMLPRAPR
ncbi:hypothetical protein ENSA7_24050 [Enhygromyxa salina]|uniref:Uncharacterized protein n=1 Tax=Enhygromyxa salina TaxID=215803 RepID=A0A2S9YS98_9BACT|nr:hypothetical protein ENSA7_24050 [Enhygromyxa salina]